ncbi:hypothetical protein G9A89_014811 [Geosiphon pyriformis]|nr:hypothetical protein G9A89_014811 [Geosiphon pyriformis]
MHQNFIDFKAKYLTKAENLDKSDSKEDNQNSTKELPTATGKKVKGDKSRNLEEPREAEALMYNLEPTKYGVNTLEDLRKEDEKPYSPQPNGPILDT